MPDVAVLDHDAVLAAVSPREAIDRTRDAFLRHRRGEWLMPAKVYLESPPHSQRNHSALSSSRARRAADW